MERTKKSDCPDDPLLSEVIANLLLSVAEEAGLALIRAAHSPNVRERRDCSTAILDPRGQIVAQAPFIPMHLGSMMGLIDEVLRRFPADSLRPGDVFLANDPYNGGGSHLPDITVVSPAFHNGDLVAFVSNIAHHADVGGMVPGSESAACTTIYQEGLRLPPVPIRPELGELDPVTQLIMLNSRTPEERLGDLQAQMAALNVGVKGVEEVYQRFGADAVSDSMDRFLDYCEGRVRRNIERLREGTYTSVDYLDDDGFRDEPVAIQCTATVANGGIVLDFAGTAPQMASGKNVPLVATMSVVYCVVKMLLDPEIPATSGTYRPVEIRAPKGCMVNPAPPAAVGARAISCGILGDVIVGALVQSMPELALAPSGPHSLTTFAGTDPRSGQPFVDYETVAGALGARAFHDGIDAVRIHASGAANLPVESLELDYPLEVVRYELVTDGGGAGAYRGGLPVRRDTRVLGTEATLSTSADRQRRPASGLRGGAPGAPGSFKLNPDTSSEGSIPAVTPSHPLAAGDIVSVQTPGGGGYGDPLDRDPHRVLDDLLDERVSASTAGELYGIVVRDGVLDLPATQTLRAELRKNRVSRPVDMGDAG